MLTAEQIDDAVTEYTSDENGDELKRLLNAGAALVEASDVLGQREVADAMGCDRSTVLRWLRAGAMPEPWARLRTGPLWTSAQVEAFKAQRAAASE